MFNWTECRNLDLAKLAESKYLKDYRLVVSIEVVKYTFSHIRCANRYYNFVFKKNNKQMVEILKMEDL